MNKNPFGARPMYTPSITKMESAVTLVGVLIAILLLSSGIFTVAVGASDTSQCREQCEPYAAKIVYKECYCDKSISRP